MERQINQRNIRGDLVKYVFSIALTAFYCLGIGKLAVDNTKERCAQRAAMTHYQPVGNGGALAEMNGRISPERQAIYQKMQQAYERVR